MTEPTTSGEYARLAIAELEAAKATNNPSERDAHLDEAARLAHLAEEAEMK